MFSDARSFLNHAVSSGLKDEAFDQLRHNLDLKEQLNKASYTDMNSKGQNPPKSEMQRITSLLGKGQTNKVLKFQIYCSSSQVIQIVQYRWHGNT